MKNLLLSPSLVFSLMFILQSNISKAEATADTEAKSCSHEECLNLSAPTNASNAGKQGSRPHDKRLAEALVKGDSSEELLQNSVE